MLEHILPRLNRRFGVSPQDPGSAFRPLDPELRLEPILCFKHKRRVAKHNTVKFQWHTLQLLPEPELSTPGAAVKVLEALDGNLSVRHQGRRVPAQEALPSRAFFRDCHERSAPIPVYSSAANGLGERWEATTHVLDSKAEEEKVQGSTTDGSGKEAKPKAPLPRPTFLLKERW